ncbi:hypothetical protein RRG08_044228 [Elysia crispata]|uniref:Uncharacterized protein n=1 Tax=Elysia crispata TaxID=231223 RepID=A0AAE0XXH8_9GAST|nr:hypothetical protein RRG08_044228 [Elysia crispata]
MSDCGDRQNEPPIRVYCGPTSPLRLSARSLREGSWVCRGDTYCVFTPVGITRGRSKCAEETRIVSSHQSVLPEVGLNVQRRHVLCLHTSRYYQRSVGLNTWRYSAVIETLHLGRVRRKKENEEEVKEGENRELKD